jgi:transcriptional regulator with XRE-family HTH domain
MKSILSRLYKMFLTLKAKDAREAFVAARVATAVAVRIFNMRKKEGWTQAELAKRAQMKQARISVLEQADNENFSFSTLRRIAAAFDVAVIIDFVSFPDFLKWSDSFSAETVVPENFSESEITQARAQVEVNGELAKMLQNLNLRWPNSDQPFGGLQMPVKKEPDLEQKRNPRALYPVVE